MTEATAKKETAVDAYIRKNAEVLMLLDRIRKGIEDHQDNISPDEVHWGHVGDIAAVAEDLRAASDRINLEGEHA